MKSDPKSTCKKGFDLDLICFLGKIRNTDYNVYLFFPDQYKQEIQDRKIGNVFTRDISKCKIFTKMKDFESYRIEATEKVKSLLEGEK